jgi:hypothetical protein
MFLQQAQHFCLYTLGLYIQDDEGMVVVLQKVIKLLGSAVHDLADAAPAEVLEFTASTSQDCA